MSEIFPAKTIAIEVVQCTDQDRIKEFNLWYDKEHVPYLRTVDGVVDVYRYIDTCFDYGELGAKYTAPPGEPVRYLTVYRLNADDPWRLMQELKAAGGKSGFPDYCKRGEVTVWDFVAVRQSLLPPVRPPVRLPDGMPESILLVFAGMDPAKKREHDDWWLYTHSHDLLELPGMTQCERFVSLDPSPGADDANLLNIYEFDCDDPGAAFVRILEDDKNIRRPQGRFSPYSRRTRNHASGVYTHWDLM